MTDNIFFYPTDSKIWEINREQVILLGGARALLMQIAHPLVAEAVYQHSYVFEKPFLRLHRTLELTLAMVFGTKDEVRRAVDEINRVHRPATGRLENATGDYPSGTPYNPRNPRLAMWVYATLVEGAINGHETFIGALSPDEKQTYYEESKQSVELLGVKSARLPDTYEGLLDYMQATIASGEVVVGETARKIAPFILLQSSWVAFPVSYPVSKLTTAILPDTIRDQYGFELNPLEEAGVKCWIRATRQIVPFLPAIVRYVPAYNRAKRLIQIQSSAN